MLISWSSGRLLTVSPRRAQHTKSAAPLSCSTTFNPSLISRRHSFGMEIPAEEDRLDCLAQFGERLIGRVLHVFLGEAPQDGFRFGRSQAQRRGVLDHLVVLLPHQLPVDRLA